MPAGERYYGIDIGGTTVKLGLFTDGRLTEQWQIPTDTSQKRKNILPDILRSLPGPAAGAGLAVPGAVLEDGTVNRCINLGWDVCRPGDEFEALSGIPCRVLNDANAAALGEQRAGAAKGFRDVLFVTLGTGVGAGLILDGRLRPGAFGTAGELGHLCLEPDGPLCSCGNRGCLETYCSATGICRLGAEAGLDSLSCREIFDMAASGTDRALAVVDLACDALGWGIAAACAIIDPQAVVLGGGVAQAGPLLLDKVSAAFLKYAFHACRDVRFLLAALGPQAGIIGAALYAVDG
ncbi:MAG: ROK family protein [Oscillospiraceae bacterium]|nr:ROK family protein [Oscillospiraceae bacterium]